MLWKTLTAAKDVGRVHEIASVLIRFGFADAVARVGLSGALERAGRLLHVPQVEAQARSPSPVRLRQALEALGPTFVKLGQLLASRVDLFGPDWIAELERLQNHAPSVPFEVIRPLLEEQLGGPLDQVIGDVDPAPLAAASIAQVHRAITRDGMQVVIKVRRPGIRWRWFSSRASSTPIRTAAMCCTSRETVSAWSTSAWSGIFPLAGGGNSWRCCVPWCTGMRKRSPRSWTSGRRATTRTRTGSSTISSCSSIAITAWPWSTSTWARCSATSPASCAPQSLTRRFRNAVVDSADALALLPDQLRRMLRSMSEGQLKLRMDVDQLQSFGEQVAHSANRLALGLIISALIVGSSIVMTVGDGAGLFGVQFFGMAGFAAAVVGGCWLLVSILRSGGGR